MPEGPEVETIRRGLELALVGQAISSVGVLWPGSFLAPQAVIDKVVGATVTQMDRRGKVLLVELDSGYTMLCHLKMTGQMVLVKADGERYAGGHPTNSMAAALPDRSTRVIFTLAGGDQLFFNDQRKFGWVKVVTASDVNLDSLIARLGPEPASRQFSVAYLAGQLARHPGAPIKAVILDQSVIAGVGNIYADESLHMARIHPARKAGTLTPAEVKRLHGAVSEIMVMAVDHGGTSFSHFVNSLGGRGDYLEHARVFRRQGLPCPVCGTIIEKTRVAGRGTHVCPKCQKLPKAR